MLPPEERSCEELVDAKKYIEDLREFVTQERQKIEGPG
jgi:hypothetical protein